MDSEYIEYYDNGQIEEKGFMNNGKKNGPFVSYLNNGELFVKGMYVDGLRHGPSELYQDGFLKELSIYEMGKANGPREYFYDSGELCRRGFCKDGKKFGNEEEYYKNGQLKSKGFWCPDKGRLQITEYYFEDGQKKMELKAELDTISVFRGHQYLLGLTGGKQYWLESSKNEFGDIQGFYKRFYNTGELFCIGNEKNYEEDGIYKEFYKNGQLKKLKTYVDGYLTGPSESYSEDGELIIREIYYQDKLIQ